MKIVQVTYIARQEFVEQNKANIAAVMAALRKIGNNSIDYRTCLSSDGVTFIHTSFFESEADESVLQQLPEFLTFQKELQASGLEQPPKQDILSLVASSRDIFK